MGSRYGLQIRAATAADAAGISDLLRAADRPVDPAALALRIDALRREGGTVLLALEWGPPSGLAVLTFSRTLATDEPIARLEVMLVAPDDRRRGIGRALLKAVAQAARSGGSDRLQLLAGADDDTLRAFCESTGFAGPERIYERPLRKRVEPAKP